jgi:hypothetical protein
VIRVIPAAGLLVTLAGAGALGWYQLLTADERRRADGLAEQHAREVFGRAVAHLTAAQARAVSRLVAAHAP